MFADFARSLSVGLLQLLQLLISPWLVLLILHFLATLPVPRHAFLFSSHLACGFASASSFFGICPPPLRAVGWVIFGKNHELPSTLLITRLTFFWCSIPEAHLFLYRLLFCCPPHCIFQHLFLNLCNLLFQSLISSPTRHCLSLQPAG